MSYYKPSFSQTLAMSRGSSRGYSSSRGGGMSYRGRGGYSSRGGGWGSSSGYDSRPPRYESSSDRYGSSRRMEDSSYKRSYRSDVPSYSSRDASSHRSPERKRMRNEGSSRRSHDNYHESSSRYESHDSHRNYPSSRSGNAYESSRSGYDSTFRAPRNESDSYRKSTRESLSSRPRPPSTLTSSYRGSRSSIRGRGLRDSGSISLLRRRAVDRGGYIRKRPVPRVSREYILSQRQKIRRRRAITIARLRRAAERAVAKEKDRSSKEKESSDSEKEESDKEDAKSDKAEKEIKKETAESAGEEKDDKKKEDKEKTEKKPTTPKKKKVAKEDGTSDKEDKKDGEKDSPRSRYTGKPFIKLTCTHCHRKCVTFNEYALHLSSGQHISAMRKIAIKQKSQLSRMRLNQRTAQREIEKNDEFATLQRSNFCPLCKLNYRQRKTEHRESEAHRQMKKFLMPYCKICRLTFKSPMLYENHLCSLSHIKRKARAGATEDDKYASDKGAESPNEEDLENMMTLDSVGDVDDDLEEKAAKDPESADTPKKDGKEINVGVDYVKKVEVYFCDLCRIYLSRHATPEREIKEHCRGRMHLQRYLKYKEIKDLRKQAERVHRKSQEAKEGQEKKDEKADGEVKIKDEKTEDGGEDKQWADLDKDLGEILAEVNNTEGGNKSSDEDEENSRQNGERYDRFKNTEKDKLKGGKKEGDQKGTGEGQDQTDEQNNDDDEEEAGENENEENGEEEEEEEEEKDEATDKK